MDPPKDNDLDPAVPKQNMNPDQFMELLDQMKQSLQVFKSLDEQQLQELFASMAQNQAHDQPVEHIREVLESLGECGQQLVDHILDLATELMDMLKSLYQERVYGILQNIIQAADEEDEEEGDEEEGDEEEGDEDEGDEDEGDKDECDAALLNDGCKPGESNMMGKEPSAVEDQSYGDKKRSRSPSPEGDNSRKRPRFEDQGSGGAGAGTQ